jgi:nucleotide-binding universal stress UspA family protein
MKKILVPCDFSDQAVQAFKFAIELAEQSKGEIILLNVIEVPVMHETVIMPTLYFEEAYFKDMRAASQKKFEKMKEKWDKEGVTVSTFVEFGPTTVTIRDFIKKKKIDLIVMGTHGATGFREFLIGSNTEKIVRTSDVPVIVLKKSVKVSSIKNIVLPNNLVEEQEDLTMHVKELQNFFKATLHIVYINTPAEFNRDSITKKRLSDFAKRYMIKNFTLNIFNDIDQEEGVRNFTREIKGDMVLMGTHGRRGLNHFMTGSIAEDIANHIECPIWTMKIK